MTDRDHTSGSGTGLIADPGDGRDDEFTSWNRWGEATGVSQAGGAPATADDRDDPPAGARESTPTESAGGDEDGFVPSRRSRNSKGRRRGGGRHRMKERRWSRPTRPRRSRRGVAGGEAEPEPATVSQVTPPAAEGAEARSQTTPEPDSAWAPEPQADPAPEPDSAWAPEPQTDPAPEPRFQPDAGEPVRPAPTSRREPTRLERDEKVAVPRNAEATRAIDEVIGSDRRNRRATSFVETAVEPATKTPERVRPQATDEPAPASTKPRARVSLKVLIAAVLLLSTLTAIALMRRTGSQDESSGAPSGGAIGDVTTTLIAGVPERGDKASWLTLLSYDGGTNEGAVVYVPAHTAVEVPGRGLQGVGDSLRDGDTELLLLSAKSLLNVEIDHYLELTAADAHALLSAVGPLTVEVPGEVRVGAGRGARLLFPEGSQELSPERVVELLYTAGLGDDELDMGPRHLAFWDAMYDTYEGDPDALSAALAGAGEVGRSDAEPAEHVRLIASLSEAGAQGRSLSVLPVQPVSVGDSELYSIQEEELAEFMTTTAHAEAPTHDAVRVQVLNGNGYPGIGGEVAGRLLGHGFRVVLSGNARKLNETRTLIVTYDSSPEGIALAHEARDLIGVGEVQVSRLDQGIVDLTVVVGKDFLRKP